METGVVQGMINYFDLGTAYILSYPFVETSSPSRSKEGSGDVSVPCLCIRNGLGAGYEK